jgi:hypothetical protein
MKSPVFLGSSVVGKMVKEIRRVFLDTLEGDPQPMISKQKNKMNRNTANSKSNVRKRVNKNCSSNRLAKLIFFLYSLNKKR